MRGNATIQARCSLRLELDRQCTPDPDIQTRVIICPELGKSKLNFPMGQLGEVARYRLTSGAYLNPARSPPLLTTRRVGPVPAHLRQHPDGHQRPLHHKIDDILDSLG